MRVGRAGREAIECQSPIPAGVRVLRLCAGVTTRAEGISYGAVRRALLRSEDDGAKGRRTSLNRTQDGRRSEWLSDSTEHVVD